MKSFFRAKCPLELGDTVAIIRGEGTTLYYLPDGMKLDEETAKKAELHKVTEIVAYHYLKAQKVEFAYQLDGTADLITYQVKVPIAQAGKALDYGGGIVLP